MNRGKRRQLDALQDRILPLIRDAFDAARPAVWERDGNCCTFKPELIGGPLKRYLDELVESRVLTSWRFDIERNWDEYQVEIVYRYPARPNHYDACRTIRFKLP